MGDALGGYGGQILRDSMGMVMDILVYHSSRQAGNKWLTMFFLKREDVSQSSHRWEITEKSPRV